MNLQLLKISKIDLFESRYLASRIACVVFSLFLTSYIIGDEFSKIDYFVLGAILGFVVQFVFQFSWLNLFMGLLMFFVGVYFSLAVYSEFSEFPIPNNSAYLLLIVGWSLCLTVCIFSVLMIRGFFKGLDD